MMNRRITLAIIAMGLVVLLFSAGPALAKGKLVGKFNATRCATFFMFDVEPRVVNGFDGTQITRYLSENQYSEWTVTSENRLVAGLFIDSNTEGNLGVSPSLGPGIYRGQFCLIPEAASGVWEGNWIMVFKSDGTKKFTGEGVGRGGELEGLIIKIYYESDRPGGTPRCINEDFEVFNGTILRSWSWK